MKLSLRSIGKGAWSLGYALVDRAKGQWYEKKWDLVRFDRPEFRAGVSVGVLAASEAPLNDILRCHLVHRQVYQNSKVTAPMLHWNDGWLVCVCRETELLDGHGYSQIFPYLCFSRMGEFKTEIVVPDCRPETSVPVILCASPAQRLLQLHCRIHYETE